ncbi:MAG: hypothetical protein IPJ87_03575 [Flavobacteriales bacterium]|nr:hypothetical protein [Flavobacteriales bacterium]MBK7940946.1 hypothetical protein [Flavobacteriales bacterium]MBK8948408.1 hypothetical protein [Flavobacteriales bacterium]MBK9701631.1 hypothetical protein [Flavobacteriales bacterium]
MDLKTLKLELLERIALIDDEYLLLVIKRAFDAPRGYVVPNEHMSVVQEPSGTDRTFTWQEVQRILEEDRAQQRALRHEPRDLDLSDDELAMLDERRERHLNGESRSYTWQQVEEILKKDIER